MRRHIFPLWLLYALMVLSASPVIAQGGEERQPITPQSAVWLEATASLAGAAETASGLAFSPDGSLLASGGPEGVLFLWDTAAGERVATLLDPDEAALPDVTSLAYRPDSEGLAAGDAGGAIRLWDQAAGEITVMLAAGDSAVTSLAFDPSGSLLAAGMGDGGLQVWDLVAGEPPAVLDGHTGAVTGLAFPAGGDALASGGADGAIWLWDMPGGEPRQFADTGAAVLHLAASPDGAILAAALDDGAIRLWDTASGEVRAILQPPEDAGFTRVGFVPGGALLVAGTADGSLTVWEIASGELIVALHGHDGAVTGLDVSAGGDLIATSGADRAIRLWLVPLEAQGALAGDPAAGAALFVEVGCVECHASEPGAISVGPAIDIMAREAGARVQGMASQEYLSMSITQPHTTIVNGFPTLLPNFDLTEQEVADLIAYILTFR